MYIPDINLLPKVERRQSIPKNLYIILTIITLLFVSFFVLQYFTYLSKISSLQKEEEQLLTKRDQLQEELDSISVDTASLKQSVDFVENISYPVSPIIDETIRLQPGHSYLREYAFTAQTAEVAMDFETLSDISKYLSRISGSEYVKDAQVSEIEHFKIKEDAEKKADFREIPRYKVKFTLSINQQTLAAGGGKQ
ncbi:PilN domain-containing protein [Ureibacillus terrenus]|uniref:Fimbrial assembly protein n=2 Tax=Caryophanaceae TaxID=186818 RepID=A0A540V6P9_9BACL|nr:hypothetical protein [Ureibacillus terrenus]MED3762669.1 hypothetical protein [Ureibacillus terrenus]TQE92454.1 hypothetical protein FKZ59_01725 [Ureibacillus terrenus]